MGQVGHARGRMCVRVLRHERYQMMPRLLSRAAGTVRLQQIQEPYLFNEDDCGKWGIWCCLLCKSPLHSVNHWAAAAWLVLCSSKGAWGWMSNVMFHMDSQVRGSMGHHDAWVPACTTDTQKCPPQVGGECVHMRHMKQFAIIIVHLFSWF